MIGPQNNFEPYPDPKNSTFVPPKAKNDPKIMLKQKAGFE